MSVILNPPTLKLRKTLRIEGAATTILLNQIALSRDGLTVVGGGGDGYTNVSKARIAVWDIRTSPRAQIITDGNGSVQSVALTPDARMVICADGTPTLKIWDPRMGRRIRTLPCGGKTIGVALSPDGQTVACVGERGAVRLWNLPTGALLRTIRDASKAACFSPDGLLLATGGSYREDWPGHGEVRLWETRTGKLRRTLPGTHTPCAFSHDGKVLAVITPNAKQPIQLWDVAAGTLRLMLTGSHEPTYPGTLAFSRDGKTLAANFGGWGDYGELRLYDLSTGRSRKVDGTASGEAGLTFTPDGKQLMVGSWGDGVQFWDVLP